MRFHYQKYLKPYSQRLRQSGNISEVLLWSELKRDKLGYRFLRQKPIGNYIVDFYCSSLNLAIEIDGAASHNQKIEKDRERQKELELLGLKVVRFADVDIKNRLEDVVAALRAEIFRIVEIPRPAGALPLKRKNISSTLGMEESVK